jgi:hypothetical protein
MQNQRVVVLVVFTIAAALALGYFIGRAPPSGTASPPTNAGVRHTASAPSSASAARIRKSQVATTLAKQEPALPAEAPRLKDLFHDLKRRADANDPAAASELYADLGRCSRTQEISRSLPTLMNSELEHDGSGDNEEQLKAHEFFLTSMQQEIDFVQRNAAFCDGADPAMLQQFVPSALKAAQLGDLKATRCYLGGLLSSHTTGLLDHREWLTEFKQYAPVLADYGLKHGDWGVVALDGFAHRGIFSTSLFGQTVQPDPVQAYQYLKLQQIGATGDFAKKITDQTSAAAADLTPAQIAQGDAWAQDTYDRYFNGSTSNELSNGVNTCGGFDDD